MIVMIFGKGYLESRRKEVYSYPDQITMETETIYPQKYYYNSENDLAEIEFIRLIYQEEDLKINIFDQDDKEIDFTVIQGIDELNEYSSVIQKKYIVQFNMKDKEYIRMNFEVSDVISENILIDRRLFPQKNIMPKEEDYLSKNMNKLIQINKLKSQDDEISKKKIEQLSKELEDLDDIDFIRKDLMNGGEIGLRE